MRGSYRLKRTLSWISDKRMRRKAMSQIRHFPTIKAGRAHGLSRPLFVTLTSYPPRFLHLSKTLKSLLDQTVQADGVMLWIAEADFDLLPKDVLALQSYGVEIRVTKDIKSYKKLVPALQENLERNYVTADDDIYYPPNWLEALVQTSKANPNCVVAGRVHLAPITEKGHFTRYRDWTLATHLTEAPSQKTRLFPTGVGGVLYPPHTFDPQVLDESLFMRLAPRGDDIWFFWMARLNNKRQIKAQIEFKIIDWPNTQDVALYNDNLHGDGNDKQIEAMSNHFGPVP